MRTHLKLASAVNFILIAVCLSLSLALYRANDKATQAQAHNADLQKQLDARNAIVDYRNDLYCKRRHKR